MQDLMERRRATLLRECDLPFKVADVLVDSKWLDSLLRGGGLSCSKGTDYAYWHKVQVWKLTRRSASESAAARPSGARMEEAHVT